MDIRFGIVCTQTGGFTMGNMSSFEAAKREAQKMNHQAGYRAWKAVKYFE